MTTATLIQNPATLHDLPDYEIGLVSREVTELLAACNNIAEDGRNAAERMMFYLGELYKQNPELANAGVYAFVFQGGSLPDLLRAARKLRNDPVVGPYLRHLKATLKQPDRSWRINRIAIERGCMWAGKTTAETRQEINRYPRH